MMTQLVDSLTALAGRCMVAAGSARLLSLQLIFCSSTYWSLQNVISSCFVIISNSHFERLRTLEPVFPFQGLSEEGADALLTVFYYIVSSKLSDLVCFACLMMMSISAGDGSSGGPRHSRCCKT